MKATMSAEKLELLSDAWYDAFSRLLAEAVASRTRQLAHTRFTICEVITDCPDGLVAAHWLAVKDGRVEFGRGIREDADSRLTVDYATALYVARIRMADVDAQRIATAAAERRYKLEGMDVRSLSPILMEALRETHDRLASVTA
jgi:hypothetical protein